MGLSRQRRKEASGAAPEKPRLTREDAMTDKITGFSRGNVVWMPYKKFLTPEENRAQQFAKDRGKSADVVTLRQKVWDRKARDELSERQLIVDNLNRNAISNVWINDRFRTTGRGGHLVLTAGVSALEAEQVRAAVDAVRAFDQFDDDPYGEHDFGAVDGGGGEKLFRKIDYDPAKTTRVLTIMLASEY
jgi:hypothetical protein